MPKSQGSFAFTALLMAIGIAGRLLPHPPNFTPLGGMANWSGTRLSSPASLAAVLGVMLISDLFLGGHTTLPYVYASIVIATLLASLIHTVTVGKIAALTLVNSVIFFLVTNFGVWTTTPIYTKDLTGLLACYAAALPFFQNTLLGDIAFTAAFFGLEYVVAKIALKTSKQSV